MIHSYFTSSSYSSQYSAQDWVTAKQGEVWRSLSPTFSRLDSNQTERERDMLMSIALYTQRHHSNLLAAGRTLEQTEIGSAVNLVTWNVAKSCVDTLASKISKNRVKVQLITDGANYAYQRNIIALDRAVYAVQQTNKWPRLAKRAFLDACVLGDGIIQPFMRDNKPCYERVPPWEVLVDPLDASYGNPTRFHRWRLCTKEAVKAMFPDKAKDIDVLPTHSCIGGVKTLESILLFEAWCCAKSGRHVVCADGVDLLDEDWDTEWPFVFLKFQTPLQGFWSKSLVSELEPLQREINRVLYYTQQSIEINHASKWLVHTGSIPKQHIRNKIGDIITYEGTKPDYIAPQPINPQVINYLQMLKQEAYNLAGISMLSARSEKPAGLNSGKALQTYNDIESERFQLLGQAYEEMHVDCFQSTVAMCSKAAKADPEFTVQAITKQGLTNKTWREFDLPRDAYVVLPYPVSAMPQEPAAKYEFLTQQMQAGLITPEEFSELNDMPDFKSSSQSKYASYYSIKKIIEDILDNKVPPPPEKYDNLELARQMLTNAFLGARAGGTPEDILNAFRLYIEDVQTLIDQLAPPAAAEPPAAPIGVPPPNPETEIMPIGEQTNG